MVLDSPPRHAYQQQSYSAAQTGYSYPQAGSGYSRPSMGMRMGMGGMGYNPAQLPNNQYQSVPMGYGNSHTHGHGHGHGHGHDSQHQNQYNGMNDYSAGAMGFAGNNSSMGQGYGPSYTSTNYSAYKEIDD